MSWLAGDEWLITLMVGMSHNKIVEHLKYRAYSRSFAAL